MDVNPCSTMTIWRPVVLLAVAFPNLCLASISAEEANTVAVFARASRGVVHVWARPSNTSSEGSGEEGKSGTGFLIDRAAHVVTAFHVVSGASEVTAMLPDGKRYAARLVGVAREIDVALLRIDAAPEELEPLVLGDSRELQVGQKVMAIGNAMGLHNTLSVGVVSALGRSVRRAPLEMASSFIQTDAAINPGNSGGPLLNSDGQVVGINDAVLTKAQGIGFAVPVEYLRHVLPDLISMGHPYRPALGFSGTALTSELAMELGLKRTRGFVVDDVLPGSAAAISGMQGRASSSLSNHAGPRPMADVIIGVNGHDVAGAADIARVLHGAHSGQVLVFRVYRNGQFVDLRLTLPRMRM